MVIYGISIILTNLILTESVPVTKQCQHDIILTNQVPAIQVQSPGSEKGQKYPLDIHCKWNISSSVKTKVSLKFLSFDIEQHPFCEWDYILIYNELCGSFNQTVKRYCGDDIPATFVSKNNNMCLEFISDKYVRKDGFVATAELIAGEESWFSTSNHPSTTSLQPSSSNDIKPSVYPVSSTKSLYNEMTLSASLSSSYQPQPLSSTMSGKSEYITTTSKYMVQKTTVPTIHVQYDEKSDKTFEMCSVPSQTIAGAEGFLVSPDYGIGKKYPYAINCTIRILSTTGKQFEISFLDFDVEYHPTCIWDKLILYDGAGINDSVLGTLCGSNHQETVTTTGTSITITFISDKYVVRRGFQIRYKLKGGAPVDASQPTYKYNTNLVTTTSLFSSHEVLPSFGTSDNIETLFTSHVSSSYEESEVPLTPNSYGEVLSSIHVMTSPEPPKIPTLKLGTAGTNKDYFDICSASGVVTTSSEGYITSPGYEEGLKYDLNLRCKLKLITEPMNRIKVTFLVFNLEPHPFCKYDNLSLYDGINTSGQPVLILCGNKQPGDVESKGPAFVLEFISDHIISRKGFKLKFQVLKKLLNSSTQLQPTKVDSIMESDSVDKSSHEALSSLELSPTYSTLRTSASTVLTSTTVSQSDISLISPTSVATSSSDTPTMATLFLQSGGGNSRTFDICHVSGIVTTGTEGFITSPGFSTGVNYGLNLDCKIGLKAKHGHRIRIVFVKSELEYHATCNYDSLSVYNGMDTSNQLVKTCGNQLPAMVNSTGSSIMMVFTSDHIIARRGFKVKFEIIKDTKPKLPPIERLIDDDDVPSSRFVPEYTFLINPSLTIISSITTEDSLPMYDSETPVLENSNLLTTETTHEEQILKLSTERQMMWSPTLISTSSMTSPYLPTVSDLDYLSEVSMSAVLSDSYLQSSHLVDKNNDIIHMCSGPDRVTISYTVEVFSPEYGKDQYYPLNVVCYLQIRSDRGKRLQINVVDFQLENHPNCKFDKLTIFDGKDQSADVVTSVCGNQFQHTYETTGPEAYLMFVSDFVVPARGFHLIINEVNNIMQPTAQFSPSSTEIEDVLPTLQYSLSPSYSDDSGDQEFSLNAKFTTEYKEYPYTLKAINSIYYEFSKTQEKSVFVSSSIIYSYTSSSVYNNSKSSTYAANTTQNPTDTSYKLPLECNGVVLTYTSPSGVVMSPGFEEGTPYPRDATCNWIIVAKKYQTIKLEFEEFALESHDQCLWDKVAIHDGSSVTSPLIGSYCGDAVPEPISSTGETLYIRLETDRMVESRGFKANYTVKSKSLQKCKIGQIACSDGLCIQEDWTCDGEKDCHNGEDEDNCGSCPGDKLRCGNGNCIPNTLQCNGVNDCPDGLDEKHCLKVDDNDRLQIMYGHVWYPVCEDNWQDSLGNVMCRYLLKGDADKITTSTSNGIILMTLKDNANMSKPLRNLHYLFHPSSYCSNQKEVILKCKNTDCGERSSSLSVPFIIGGSRSYLGQWPWVVGIKIGTKFVCGGGLISDQWVVTAAHCIESISASPHKARILIGSISRDAPKESHYRSTGIIVHPDNVYIHNADIALLRLQRPVNITNYVRPICVQPDTLSIADDNVICYVAGWGVTKMSDYYTTMLPDYLNHVKMRLVHQSKCKLAYNSRIKNTMLCAGYQYGHIDTCKGDSGSPLMCKFQSKWVLVGVTSWGETPCGQAGKPGVYTRVQSYSEWINTVTAKEEPTLSCTFETHALCGYIDVSKNNIMWTRRNGGWNRPATDYTTKSAKGHYMYAESSTEKGEDAILKTPNIAERGEKCLTFSYTFYGEPDVVLTIEGQADDSNNTSQVLIKLEHTSGDWKTTNVTVTEEIKSIMFIANVIGIRKSGIAIDDIIVNIDRCNDNDIFACTFDDKTVCDYTQQKDDFSDWELQPTDTSGYHLQFNGSGKVNGDKAKLSSPILSSSASRCLEFSFRICKKNSGKINIHSVVDFGGHFIYTGLLWSSQNNIESENTCPSWSVAKANLKAETYSYRIVIEAVRGGITGLIDIDDLKIYNGNCF